MWRWDPQEPFGVNVPDENPSALGAFKFPFRFTGQYFDVETNLNYNYFRDYDSALGRYVESDPLGLSAGTNTYAYVGSDPLAFFDPMGLLLRSPLRLQDLLSPKDPIGAPRPPIPPAFPAEPSPETVQPSSPGMPGKPNLPGDGMSAPGDCSTSYHRYLQDQVDTACAKPRRCTFSMLCEDLYAREQNAKECADARKKINDTCFRGGNRTHQIEYTKARRNQDACFGYYAAKGCC